MYWIYLVIFTFVVFVPTVVSRGYWMFNKIQSQEFAILLLGSVGFAMFLIQEKRLKKHMEEKTVFRKQMNRMTKDLTHSYSYIGEINRKLDILENIALGFPESSDLTTKKQIEIYDSIMGAIGILGKSDEFVLRFVQKPSCEVIKEIKSNQEVNLNYSFKDCEKIVHYLESDEYVVALSPKCIDNVFACIVIAKKQPDHHIEDHEMMKTLAAQALFLYMFTRKKNQIKCVI